MHKFCARRKKTELEETTRDKRIDFIVKIKVQAFSYLIGRKDKNQYRGADVLKLPNIILS